jgi:hypothetical protein
MSCSTKTSSNKSKNTKRIPKRIESVAGTELSVAQKLSFHIKNTEDGVKFILYECEKKVSNKELLSYWLRNAKVLVQFLENRLEKLTTGEVI